jgi:hypothetical protein
MQKRKIAAYAVLKDLKDLGFEDLLTNSKMKGTLLQAYVRPRLTYGLEAYELTKQDMEDLITTESKIIKRALGVPNKSYKNEIYEALGIVTLEHAIKKRRLSFLKQLAENDLTIQLLKNEDSSMQDVILQLGLVDIQKDQNIDAFKSKISREINRKMLEIKILENRNTRSDLSKNIEYLINHRTKDNEATLQYLIASKNGMRIIETDGG